MRLLQRIVLLFFLVAISMPVSLHAHQQALRGAKSAISYHVLAPDFFIGYKDERKDNISIATTPTAFPWGFVQFFKKLFAKKEDENEPPQTSEQKRAAWHEEERHAEYAFCTDVGFRGLHPDESGEET